MPSYDYTDPQGRSFTLNVDSELPPDQVFQRFVDAGLVNLPQPQVEETPGYLSQLGSALGLGYRQMKSGVGATFNALTGDTEDVAAEMAEQAKLQREQQAAQTPQDIEFMRRLDEAEKAYELARGPVETISALSQYPAAAFAEPGAAFKTAVQSAPNVLISGATSLAGYGLGGLVGGAAGIEAGPGAILTGIAGAAAGGALSNTLMEAGPSIFDALNEKTNGAAANMTAEQISAFLKANPDVIEQGLKTGAIRGSVIGAVEALGVKGSGRLLTMPERAAARAAQKTLVDAGVDVTSKKAVDAALLDPTIRSATKTAAEAAKSQFSSAGNLARMAGASAIETGAAGAGELAAQAAAGQDISTKEAFMEMLGEAALSAPMAAATKAVEGAKYALTPSQEAEQPEATQAEPTVVPTAEEPPSMLPFTREDIRATQLPFGREDIRSTELPFTREDIRATQLPFGREDIRATELPFSRQNIRGLSMIQPEIAIAQNAIAATQNVPFTDVSGQAVAAIIEQNNQIASQPTIQPKQAAEEVGTEVTPSPAMEMPSPPQGVDMASAPVSPIITEAPLSEGAERVVTPEEESLAAKRRADLLSAAADVAKGKTKAQVSPAVTAMVTPQPVETQEDAVQEQIPDEGVLRQERPKMELQGVGEGNIQPEEVAETSQAGEKVAPREGVYNLETRTNFAELPASVRGDRFVLSPVTGMVFDRMYAQYVTPPAFTRPDQAVRSLNESRYNADVSLPVSLGRSAGGADIFTSASDLPPVVIPQQTPSPPTTGAEPPETLPAGQKVTPGGVATERDLTNLEQMTPEEIKSSISTSAKDIDSRWEKLKSTPAPESWMLRNDPPMATETGDGRFYVLKKSGKYKSYDSKKDALANRTKSLEKSFKERSLNAWADHNIAIAKAIQKNLPVSSEAVDTYRIKLPEGYVRQGELYVFQPQTTKAAAEKQTPVPLREGTGAAGVVQSEPVEGSIPTDEKVSPETESASSGKLDTVAQIDRLVQSGAKPEEMDKFVKSLSDDQFNELVASEAFDVEPKLAIKPKDTYDAKRIKRRKFVDAVNASTKEVRKTAQQVFQEEEAAAKKQQAGEEMRSKAIDSIIGASEKKKRKFGQVTNSDAIAAVAMLVSSKDVPGVLTTWTGTKDEFLRDPANQTADPEIYARIKAGELVEGFFNKGRAYVFLDGIGVSDEDMLRGEQMSVTPQVAAVRRVLLHESLVHRGIHGLPLRHRRLILNWVRQNSTPAELDDLAKLYTEYANWRNSDYDFEALAEELLAKKVDSLTEIPKDGPMAKLMDILRQIWDFIVGYKREPTLSDLKSVVKLLKSGAEALANDRLKDGGEVKLSYAGEKAIENLPEERRQFMHDSLETAKAMAAAGKDSEEIRAVTGWFPGKYDGKMRWEVPDEGASLKVSETIRAGYSAEDVLSHPDIFSAYPDLKSVRVAFIPMREGMRGSFDGFGVGKIEVNSNLDDAEKLSTLLHEIQHWVQGKEGFSSGGNPDQSIRNARIEANEKMKSLNERIMDNNAVKATARYRGDEEAYQKAIDTERRLVEERHRAWEIGQQDPIQLYRSLAGEIEARDVQVRQKLTPEQRAATAPYSSENIAPEDAIVLFGSGPQASVQFSSETSAALSAGSEAARSTLYSERDMDIREAIRRAYEAMPKTNSVAVPIGELFAKTEELMPGVTQEEFSLVLQDLFEDNGAVLQEGESDFFVTTPEGKRAGFVVVMPMAAKASRIKADDAASTRLKDDIAAIENGSFKSKFGGVQFTDFPASERTVKPKEFYTDAAIRFVNDLQDKGNSIEDIAFSIQSPDFLEAIGIENNLSAQDALTIEVRNRVNNELRREKRPDRKKRLDKMNKRLSGYWQGTGSKAGANLGIRKHLINDPRYRWMFIKDLAEKGIAESVENVARGNMDSPEGFADKANAEGEKAIEQAGQAVADEAEAAVEDDLDAQLLREGEALLDTERRKIWDRIKDILRKLAIIARARSKRVPNAAKASISKSESDAIFKMSDDELAKLEKELLGEFDKLAKAFLGEESTTDTPAKKTTRAKRKAMVDTAKKRAESGKEISPEAKEAAAIEMAENKASQIVYRFEELYRQGFKNPPEGMSKKEQKDSIIKAFRDQVKNPTSFEAFAERLANLKVGEEVAERMFLTASRERADLIRVKDFKIAKRKVEIADKQASRLIYSTEERFRQGSKDLETSKDGDSINKAFRDQVSTPVSEADFSKRLAKLNVSPDVAARLFKTAAREKADLEAMEAFRLLEGPDALKNILREIELMRRGEEIPLRTPIPWRQLLSQKAKTVAEYRQRIFDAISSNEAFQNLPDDKKARLADLFSEAWESKRKDILDRMLTNLINQEEAAKRISKEGAKALREQRMKLVEDINLGILDAEEVMKRLAEKFGIKTEFTEQERQKIDSLIETVQDETLNRVKRNKAAYELLKTLSGDVKIPVVKMLADYWVASVLSGMNTATSIALAVGNGAFELLSGAYRVLTAAIMNPKEVPAEIVASFKAMAAFLKAFKREGNLAWQYLVTGDREFLDPSMNDVLNDLNYESIGRSTALAEKMAESDKIAQKVMGIWMRSVSRLLTALDSFNAGVTKGASLFIVARQLDLNPEGIAKVEQAMNLQNYKDIIIQRDFAGIPPKTAREKAVLDSWAKDEMMAELDKYGKFSENANFYGQQGAMTLEPSGLGGFFYRAIKSLTGSATTGADKFLAESQRKWKQAESADKAFQALQLGLAYFLQFGAYNSANLAGLRFARFAGNKFNQGLSFLPGIGMLRYYEASLDKTHIEAEEAFTDMLLRNQLAGTMIALAGYAMLQAISDEPDDEKRGWFINGSWANLTPEKKQQKLAAGQKEFTIGIGDKVFSYQNWPISSALAAIGGLSDLIRFSPEQWNEKNAVSRLTSAATSGVFAATEIPALSGFQTLFGNNLSSKDPNEKKLDRFANVMAGWSGGFVPRILKDFDYLAEPELRKYETLWEKTAAHIPIYRRYEGKEYYDILGKQIERKIYPGSREFMEKPSDPEYQVLGKLNSRGIWLTPANAEYRMVGKGRNRRRLTQEEADAYSLETGKGYRQMLLRYGQRALQMPTERARAFLSDKADEVRDRALKKVYRGYK